jgi:hypothetical protein
MLLDAVFDVVFRGVVTEVYVDRFVRVTQANGRKELAIFAYVIEYWT